MSPPAKHEVVYKLRDPKGYCWAMRDTKEELFEYHGARGRLKLGWKITEEKL